jgi:hypothetical protein
MPYMKWVVKSKNDIHDEMKTTLNLGNACCHLIQNLLLASVLTKNLKIKISKTIFSFVLYACEIWTHILNEEEI